MLNLNRISPKTDFCSEINRNTIMLEILNKNILYCTHEIDKVKKIVNKLETNLNLQKQVDEYFEDETSPQTDNEDKEPD